MKAPRLFFLIMNKPKNPQNSKITQNKISGKWLVFLYMVAFMNDIQ